jgi:hypothetical protein
MYLNRECIKVLRIEDGTLLELADAFLGLTRGFTVPAGSVVVLSSASYLALVGTVTYARDFVSAAGRLVSTMGGGIELVHGIPILLSGTEDSALIRSMADLHHWLGHIHSGRDITRARDKFAAQILGLSISAHSVDGGTGLQNASVLGRDTAGPPEATVGTGPPEAPVHYPLRLELPVSKNDLVTGIFKSPGYKMCTGQCTD